MTNHVLLEGRACAVAAIGHRLVAPRAQAIGRAAQAVWTLGVGILALASCQDPRVTVEVTISSADQLPAVDHLTLRAWTPARTISVNVPGKGGQPLVLPTPVRLNVSSLPAGDITIDAAAFGTRGLKVVAYGSTPATLPAPGFVEVVLHCEPAFCGTTAVPPSGPAPADAGQDDLQESPDAADADPDAPDSQVGTCGNGRLDPGEICDVALAAGSSGSCPTTCDDGIDCTRDERVGERCDVLCLHSEITESIPGDGCCLARGQLGTDSDCSPTCNNQHIEAGEVCDTGIVGQPGACPDAPSCVDLDPCTTDLLLSEGTCSARCIHLAILRTVSGDGCCPVAADATVDKDCPAACGNGVEEPGEECDTEIAVGKGACPTPATCDDHLACTRDQVVGSGCGARCTHTSIDVPAAGDGCCPTVGLSRNVDSDCPARCGNGVVEIGETCDMGVEAGQPGSCPVTCGPPPAACTRLVMRGSLTGCSAQCVPVAVSACSAISDGCCPARCTSAGDPDCSSSCGNGQLDPGETCDTAISPSLPGACPRVCADGIACTDDLLVGAGTCNARCVFVATTTIRQGDGCCPEGAHAGIDSDCQAVCGNGVVETAWETCDTTTSTPSCPGPCPPQESCSTWKRTATTDCDPRCERQAITSCANADGCCGPGCNATSDSDCVPRCGNGVVEPPETCDRAITAGHPGACPAVSCSDGNPCTMDFASGTAESCTRSCSHVLITACAAGDRCCPMGCDPSNDGDCQPASCGDSRVQARETCDPVLTCPTNCPSDGDPCTVDQLVGSATSCTAACAHVPILRCSGIQRDGCCPTDCGPITDSDC